MTTREPIAGTRPAPTCRRAGAIALVIAAAFAPPLAAQDRPAAPAASAAAPTAAPQRIVQALAPGVWWLAGRFDRGRQPDGNSLLLEGPDGIVVVDSGRHVEHTGALLAAARARGRPIVAVINTHWHLDHLGGNLLLRREAPDLKAYGSAAVGRAVRESMAASAAGLRRQLADPNLPAATQQMMRIDLALYDDKERMAPDVLLDPGPAALVLGGRRLRVGVEPRAVTAGDAWVLDEATRTLAAGDLVNWPVPFFDTACAEGWQQALARIDALPWERLVPGHGPVLDRAGFARWRRAFDQLLACAATNRPSAECAAVWTADLGPLAEDRPQASIDGMVGYYFEQHLRAPAAQRDRFCSA